MVGIPLFPTDTDHSGGAVEEYDSVTDVLHVVTKVLHWRYGCTGSVDAMHMVLVVWGSRSWVVTDGLLQAGRRRAGDGPKLM
jgi:hypothetical protein